VSYPDPDWALDIWCGSNPALDYNGGYVISHHRSLEMLPADVEVKLREAAERLGIDYDTLCESDNSLCPN
jgi:hypothetical protein